LNFIAGWINGELWNVHGCGNRRLLIEEKFDLHCVDVHLIKTRFRLFVPEHVSPHHIMILPSDKVAGKLHILVDGTEVGRVLIDNDADLARSEVMLTVLITNLT
jgi:hypothetical protein